MVVKMTCDHVERTACQNSGKTCLVWKSGLKPICREGRRTAGKRHKSEYCTVAGKELINHKITVLAKVIDEWKEEASKGRASSRAIVIKYVQDIPSETPAFLTLRQIVAGISGETPLSRVALSVGQAIEDEVVLTQTHEEENTVYKRIEAGAKKRTSDHNRRYYSLKIAKEYIEFDRWGEKTRLHIGMKLIALCQSSVCGYPERQKNNKDAHCPAGNFCNG